MNTHILTVYDEFFDKYFTGEFIAGNVNDAMKECREFYAYAHDTNPEDISIVKMQMK